MSPLTTRPICLALLMPYVFLADNGAMVLRCLVYLLKRHALGFHFCHSEPITFSLGLSCLWAFISAISIPSTFDWAFVVSRLSFLPFRARQLLVGLSLCLGFHFSHSEPATFPLGLSCLWAFLARPHWDAIVGGVTSTSTLSRSSQYNRLARRKRHISFIHTKYSKKHLRHVAARH